MHLGANLARVELRGVFEEMLRGLSRIELAVSIKRLQMTWDQVVFGGYRRVPVHVGLASSRA
ncbi:MAG: hypothetical protein GY910_14665 [bacterium]|nr:hypothetical protein [Deltaproteobacteria bacterium]MCP4906216.1 hypothetical protein [bacterium]